MKHFLKVAIVAAALSAPAYAASVDDTFSSFYSFGDSLTDDGKFGLAGAGGLLEAPSFGGRFTNGLTWSEYIEDTFDAAGKDTRNYALGGATAGDLNVLNPGPLATFGKQIDAFQAELSFFRTPGANPLVSLWFGANDIFQGITSPIDAANAVAAGVRRINSLGTVFDDFLIFDLPNIPGAPGVSDAFNQQLSANIAGLLVEGLNIIRYDPQDATDEIVADFLNGSPEYGITEFIVPCTASFTDGDPIACTDIETRFFADTVHPTAKVHEVTAMQVSAAVIAAAAPIPLPAGGLLLLAGLGAFAVARRRAA